MNQRDVTETLNILDTIRNAQREKSRAYQRDYYAAHKEQVKLNAMRRSYEKYAELLSDEQGADDESMRPN